MTAPIDAASRRLDSIAREHPELCAPRSAENVDAWIETLVNDEKGSQMAPKSSEPGEQLAFRLPKALVARLDRHAERLERENPGLAFTRTDAVRTLLTRALDDVEGSDKRRAK